jgi:acetyl coenzyme A synthetase (ADP forming)-like protein
MLDMFFNPQSLAVIGAAREEGKLGYGVLNNVITHGFKGKVYPINPKAGEILGLKCYPSVLAVPEPIDLVVVVVPNSVVASVMEECGQKGVKGAIIITAGFRESGGDGMRMEKEILAIARRHGIRLIGPNCLGIIDTVIPLNASFAVGMPAPGKMAFMSQSGALCTSVLDWAQGEGIGFSRFVSLGNKADLNEIDFLEAWGKDDKTRVILGYLEGITDGPKFIRTARKVTRAGTPVIAIKSGTTSAGSRAVSSHTGTLAGAEAAYEAAFLQSGVLRAHSVEDLFDFAVAFARQPLLPGDRIALVTNAGGLGIMATDACERAGLKMATLQTETVEFLRGSLPPACNVYNPIDVLGDALADRYALGLEAACKDTGVDGVLCLLSPQIMTKPVEIAHALGAVSAKYGKPVLACFMGDVSVREGIKALAKHRIPNYKFPERAVSAFKAMSDYRNWLARPVETPPEFAVDKKRVKAVFQKAQSEGRLGLGDFEARDVLDAYGFKLTQSGLAKTADEAVVLADKIGYPVVMKVASPDILHKSDIGAVKLNVADATAVRDTFELITYRAARYVPGADIWGITVQEMAPKGKEVIIGVTADPQFGPVLMFGLGGIYVEVLKDVVFRVAPLTRLDALEMVQGIKSFPLLKGVRGDKPVDLDAAVDAILRISQLVIDFPEIVELDVNPLLLYEKGSLALDMRIILAADKT